MMPSTLAGQELEDCPQSANACGLLALPCEVLTLAAPRFLDRALPVACLASCCRGLRSSLTDTSGRLRTSMVITCRLDSVLEGLQRISLPELRVLRVDLSAEKTERLTKQEIEKALRDLGNCLVGACALEELSIRLASFDAEMERIRLGWEAWEALIRGLNAVAQYHRLRSLELNAIAIKASLATQSVNITDEKGEKALQTPGFNGIGRQLRRAASSPSRGVGAAAASGGELTFLEALGRLDALEDLTLAHDEIFGCTAQLLPPIFLKMPRLRKVDVTRNHISKQVMQALKGSMPDGVALCGDDQQTFFFY